MVSKVYGVVAGVGLLLLLMSQAHSSPPQVVPESRINIHFYDVNATSPDQLARALAHSAPKIDGKAVLGKASYQVDWQLETEQLPASCQLRRVTVMTQASILLPRWIQSAGREDVTGQRWGRLLANMFDYESRFKEMALQGANQVGRSIAILPDHRDCDALRYAAWRVGSDELTEIRRRMDAFQIRYDYGEALGVHWPK